MVPTLRFKLDTVWRPHRRTRDNHTVKPIRTGVRRWPSYRARTISVVAVALFLTLLLVGISSAVDLPAERCPCPEMTVVNILETGADGGCVDVPPAIIFTREGNNSVYIASRNLCTVHDPPNRRVEWIAIGTDGEFNTCRNVILTAADKLGISCTDTYHPTPTTPSRERTLASPGS